MGGTGSYTITLENKGGSATSGVVTFTDTLPTGLSFNAQTAGAPELACTAAGQVVTCTGSPDIAVAGTESVTYSVDVAGSASGTLINGVLLTALGGDPRTPANDAEDPSAGNATQGSDKLSAKSAQSVTSGASLATTKTLTKVNGATTPTNYLVSSGDALEYTVSVANTGGQSGTTTLTETVPDNTSYSGSSEGWTVASGNYTQDVTVAAGATVTKTFTVTVGTLGDGALSIANTVASSSGSCSSSSCTVTNATDPRLSISKSVPSSLPVGGTGSYTITLENKGGSATSGVVTFTDTLPTGLSFNAQTAGAPELACTAAGQVVTCTGSPDIAVAGTESVTYSVDVAGSASGTLINGVLLTALGGDPRTPANDAEDPSAGNATQGSDKLSAKSAQSVTSGASLATTKTLTKVNGATTPTNYLVSSGDALEYTVSVANTGGQSGTTTLTETVPDNTSYSGSSEGWTVASGNYTQDVTVAAGATVTKTFTVTVGTLGDGALSIANTVASSSGSCSSSSCTVTNATDPRLSISKSVPSSLPVGGTGSYTITLENKGGSATSGVVTFTDTLPTGLSFNAQTAGAPELACTAAGQVVTCTGSPDIAVAGTESVTYSVDVAGSASGTLINGVLLTALGGDPRTPANDAEDPSAGNATQGSDKLSAKSAQSVTSGASLATTKTLTKVNGATTPTNYLVSSGDALEYTVSVANTGGQSGTTTLTETVPDNTSYSGSSEGWTVASGNYTQDVTVAAGATVTKTFTVTVGTLGDGALSIANTVASSSGSCSSCSVTTVVSKPSQTLAKVVTSKTGTAGAYAVGDVVTYTITQTNTGNVTLNNVVITDAKLTESTTTGKTGSCASVAPSATCVLEGTYTITQTEKDAGTFKNTASVKSTEIPTALEASNTITLAANAKPTLSKTLTSNADEDKTSTITVGDTLTYTVTLLNDGDVTLTDTTITDDKVTPSSASCSSVVVNGTCVLTGTYKVTQADVDAGKVVNNAASTSKNPGGDTLTREASNTETITQSAAQTLAKVVSSKTGTAGAYAVGDVVTYTITQTNTGNVTLNNVVITDAKLTASTTTGKTGSCASVAPSATCVLEGTYTITQTEKDAGTFKNTASVKSTEIPTAL